MSKLLRTICIAFILLVSPTIASASCNILIDGEQLICYDSNGTVINPFVENGTTYVPVRAVAQVFNVSVAWDQETKTVYLGEKGGNPTLSDNINIYYEGTEFICYDANNSPVYPILRDSATYLPLRGIGQLFGKNVAWDNISRTAVLTTPAASDAYAYLLNSISNTESYSGLNQNLSFTGTMYYNDDVISTFSDSETNLYSSSVFTLSSAVSEKLLETVSYMGNGKYFIYAPSTRFATSSYIIKAMMSSIGETTFSSLFITVSTNGGYVTDISLNLFADLLYNDLIFKEQFNITSEIIYPEDFSFPHIPYPETNANGNNSVFYQDAEDAVSISRLTDEYLSSCMKASAEDLVGLLHSDDYDRLFANKSLNQKNLQLNTMSKKLGSLYGFATENYTVSSMVYEGNPEIYQNSPQEVAKISLQLEYTDGNEIWYEDIDIFLSKVNGKWYIDYSMAENLI